MKAHLGIAPIAWSNDDLPELGGDTPLETCLAQAAKAGFCGIETGGKFPSDTASLRAALAPHDLRLCGGWYSGTILDQDLEQEIDQAYRQLELFRDLGAPCMVYGETAGTIQNIRDVTMDKRRLLDDQQLRTYAHRLSRFCEWAHDQGMPIALHHHMGTVIEREHELDIVMNNSSPAVKLTLDTGHMVFGHGNNLNVIRKYAHRIIHVHTKDIRASVLKEIDSTQHSFLDAVLAGVFTVPGDGGIDFASIITCLAEHEYEGWFVVEAEQDPQKANPYEYACMGCAHLHNLLQQAGYEILRA
ncbi:MAG: myo-inosose-2 dehydratase [Pseudomonadota bacterium]